MKPWVSPLQITVVIPAFNESNRLPRTLLELQKLRDANALPEVSIQSIIVVNDGSTDNTAERVDALIPQIPGLSRINNPGNQGKGYSIRNGILASETDWILIADADMATPWEEIQKLAHSCLDQNALVAIGSRDLKESRLQVRQSWIREFLGRCFNGFVRLMTPLPFKDTQCGFKLFHRGSVLAFTSQLNENGFAWDVEFLMQCKDHHFKVTEVPIEWSHQEESKVRLFRDGFRMVFALLRLRGFLPKKSVFFLRPGRSSSRR